MQKKFPFVVYKKNILQTSACTQVKTMLYINGIRCIFIHSTFKMIQINMTLHTHPHVQIASILSTVAEHNVRVSVVEDSSLRWVKEHSLHLLHPPDPQPWISHFMGKLALCCPKIKHPDEGERKSEEFVCMWRSEAAL